MEFLKSRLAAFVVSALWLSGTLSGAFAQSAGPNEYALRSVFLYNFCNFIEWPNSAFGSPSDPLVIGVIGDDPFGSLLREAVEGEKYHGRPIQIEHYRSPKEIRRCHILFIPRSENDRLEAIVAAVGSRGGVVTVGETDDFLDRGGMIALPADHNRVRLRINASALRAASLTVSSKLLRVADSRM